MLSQFTRSECRIHCAPILRCMDATIDPEGKRLPIKLDTASNGEFVPVPLSKANRAAKLLAHESASANAKRLGLSRRQFLVSSCGAASTLLAFNAAHGTTAGFFEIEPEAALDLQLAQATLGDKRGGKGEFVSTSRAISSTPPAPG